MPSARCCSEPTPPEAITGIDTASDTARVSARSKPLLVPSRSMLVSRISPAPSSAILRAHSTASSPVALRPPCVKTSQRGASPSAEPRLASIATTMHCEPYLSVASRTSCGFATAYRQRNEHLQSDRFNDRQDQVALVGGGGDVEEGEFVGALPVVAAGNFA